MVKKLILLGLILFTINVNGQVINLVQYESQADIKVYLTNTNYTANIIVYKTTQKYEAQGKLGYWYWGNRGGDRLSKSSLNVFIVKYRYQADYSVYVTNKRHEVKLTNKYINEVKTMRR